MNYKKHIRLSLVIFGGLTLALNQAHAMGKSRTSSTTPTTPSAPTTSPSGPAPLVARITDPNAPLDLVYSGAGSCSVAEGDAGTTGYGCSEASADIASAAGFRVQYVGPNDLSSSSTTAQVQAIFGSAKVWIQPGGVAETALAAMSSRLKTELVNFISTGGGYVGTCAGAFIATAKVGSGSYTGLGIFPGKTAPYRYTYLHDDYALLEVNWSGVTRDIYFEGGPYIYDLPSTAQTMATFVKGGAIAAARASYNLGRVYISGPHVEAPSYWTSEDGFTDPDGPDYALGVQMIDWAAGLTNN
jgi:glutamine amidotransferase PdxT